MGRQFQKHYSREEARVLLPEIREWLERLTFLRGDMEAREEQLSELMKPGKDLGGELVNSCVRTMAEMKSILLEFFKREIQIKDLDRGLIDFPALRDGKEVFLCWEKSEEDISFWHDLEAGYAGREPLEED